MKYFVSFVEEGIMNPDYYGYVGGRVELWSDESQYDIDEFRFLTKRVDEFNKFREKWDLRDVTLGQIEEIKKTLKDKFKPETIWEEENTDKS